MFLSLGMGMLKRRREGGDTCQQSRAFCFNWTASSFKKKLTYIISLYFELNFLRLVHLSRVHTLIFDSISLYPELSALNLLWCLVLSHLSWWKPVVMPRVTLLPLDPLLNCWDVSLPLFLYPTALFLSALTYSQSLHSNVRTFPITCCPHVSVPRWFTEELDLSVASYYKIVINLPSKTHIFTLLYFMNTLWLALLWGCQGTCCCILDRPIIFCVFDVFQEMGSLPPLSGIVLISQITGRNKSQNFIYWSTKLVAI